MTFTICDIHFPNWEVIHIYQDFGGSTILLLRRTTSVGECLAVGKIIALSRFQDKVNEATVLARIPAHSGIIKLYSTQVGIPRPGQVTLILEFCAGEDLFSFLTYAHSVRRRIPEGFLWHVLCQALVAIEHLDRNDISHNDLHLANLLLRPVGGDDYPDVVLADFEISDKRDARHDFQTLGMFINFDILERADEIADGTALYSQELRNFVNVLSGNSNSNGLRSLRAEMERDLIPLARKFAYGDNRTTPRMPVWMVAYFVELRAKADPKAERHVPPEVQIAARQRVALAGL